MIQRPFRLALDDGEAIRGTLRIPEGTPPESAVVVVHGFKGFMDWGFFPYLAEALAGDGHAVISFNFSLNGVGEDPTGFTELEAFARNTFSREVEEILRVLRAVRDEEIAPRPPRKIGLLGHSRGGGEAVIAARDDGRVDALATWAGVASFDRWSDDVKEEWRRQGRIHVLNARTGQQMPLDLGLLEDYEKHRERLDVLAAAARLEVPWLIVHGEEDAAVSVHDAHGLAGANGSAELEIVPRAGHAFEVGHPFRGPSPELERALERTRKHFRRHLLEEDDAQEARNGEGRRG